MKLLQMFIMQWIFHRPWWVAYYVSSMPININMCRDEATVGSRAPEPTTDFGPALINNISAGTRHSRVQGEAILLK